MRKIPLKNRLGTIVGSAIVDDEDFERLQKWHWHMTDQGYAASRKSIGRGKSYILRMHREILNANRGQIVDHINSKRLDNRKSNLRFCTKSENSLNRPKRADNTSGAKNVYWSKCNKRWYVKTKVKGKEIRSQDFRNKRDAISASKTFILNAHGKYAYQK